MKQRKKKKRRSTREPVESALSAALAHHQAGRLSTARIAYEKVLESDPTCVDALYLLGRLMHQTGNMNQAIKLLRQALMRRPLFPEAQNDLGNMLNDAGQLEDAAKVLRDLITASPRHADAHNNLGVVFKKQGKLEAAVRMFEQAIQLDPQSSAQHFNVGNTFKQLHRFDQAVSAYRRTIALQPKHADAYRQLSTVLRRIGNDSESRDVLKQWAGLSPNDPVARHMLAALSDADPPPRASDAYIKQVFDQFADTFDDDLNDLDYQGPQLLARVLGDRLPSADAGLDVLDAGCGTGLCGHVLRPYARYLAGVDLSESMIDKARCLNIYDDLVVDELTAFLAGSVKGFDLIACIDTLIYFGDLEEVLAKMTALLRDGGRLVVTCEASADARSTHGYHLAAHGRYCHTKPYVQRCLTLSGITNMVITEAVIRTEAGEAANGYVVLASKTVGRQP